MDLYFLYRLHQNPVQRTIEISKTKCKYVVGALYKEHINPDRWHIIISKGMKHESSLKVLIKDTNESPCVAYKDSSSESALYGIINYGVNQTKKIKFQYL